MNKEAVLKIFGRVQGVFFRANIQTKAQELGLAGWAKNEPDGTVKILAQGEKAKLQQLIKWCYNGVKLARVEKIEVKWREMDKRLQNFEIH